MVWRFGNYLWVIKVERFISKWDLHVLMIRDLEQHQDLLRMYFPKEGLSGPVAREIAHILEEQFKSFSVAGGALLLRPSGLELKIVRPELKKAEETALARFARGDMSGLDVLKESVHRMAADYETYLSDLDLRRLYLQSLSLKLNGIRDSHLDPNKWRSEVSQTYRRLFLSFDPKIEDIITAYEAGDDDVFDRLYELGIFAYKLAHHEVEHAKEDVAQLGMLNEWLERVRSGPSLSLEEWNDILLTYRTCVLMQSYSASKDELCKQGALDDTFCGLFLVEPVRRSPTLKFVAQNAKKDYPFLVIAANAAYQVTGVKLHLIHSGDYETLYEGPLRI